MTGVYTIPSSGAYVSQIRFSGAGLCWGGRKNGFTAVVFRRDDPRRAPVYSLEGVWSDAWTAHVAPLDMAPLDAQDPWESKRAWRDVAAGLRSGDVRAAVAAKTELERAQREMRAVEADEGRTWAPLLFRSAPGAKHDVFHRLAEGMEGWEHLYDERTKGVWRVDEAALKTQRPFRGELTPLG
ncbi:Oxysterol-binding protein 4 like [Verticillium longisporum]|nr:Oxysterol-binding protein 4 like [Verticillium longisporum]